MTPLLWMIAGVLAALALYFLLSVLWLLIVSWVMSR